MIEIERRYKVTSPDDMVRTLGASGITLAKEQHIIDRWFIPNTLRTRQEHDAWFDEEHGEAFRIRQTEQPDGSFSVLVDSKQHTEASNHNTFREHTFDTITDLSAAEDFLADKSYRNWLTIDKTRKSFDTHDPNVDIVLDEIAGLAEKIGVGAVLELEFKGDASRDEVLALLREKASKFGLTDDDLFEKSLTVASMDALARFTS